MRTGGIAMPVRRRVFQVPRHKNTPRTSILMMRLILAQLRLRIIQAQGFKLTFPGTKASHVNSPLNITASGCLSVKMWAVQIIPMVGVV